MKKMLMLATTAAMIEQFNKNNILILEEMGYEVHVAGNWKQGNPISEERLEKFKEWLGRHHGRWYQIPAVRNPADVKNNLEAYKIVLKLIRENHYEFIHCHTPIGSVIGRVAAHFTHTKVVYTAHGFHFFKGAPLKNWLLYYPVEKFLSRWTDVLITINQEDYQRAQKSFHTKRTEYVPGVGVELEKYNCVAISKEEKRKELFINKNDFVLISVGELNKNKNHEVVIKALAELDNKHIIYVICGQGELKTYLEKVSSSNNLTDQVKFLGYREDIYELLKMSDAFVFPSIREGLGVALLEAMSSGLPCIVSSNRGNENLIIDGINGLVIENYIDYKGFANAILKIMNNDRAGKDMGEEAKQTVTGYSLNLVNERMKEIYQQI